ncbi:MAG: aminotransferase class I/II-fold pyridoxal phosphate-dependent enzyme [Microlunatus sp.]
MQARTFNQVPKITLTERRSLTLNYNLADAQNYVSMDECQLAIIDQLPDIFHTARDTPYAQLKRDFVSTVQCSLGQEHALSEANRTLLCYSATIGLEIAITYIRQTRTAKGSVGLIHPTFDTLSYIAHRHGLDVKPIEESELLDPESLLESRPFDAIILTLPNNPTGFQLSQDHFSNLVRACRSTNTLIVIDCCYRYYSQESYDFYKVLNAEGVDYLLVEDTGKIFPLLDVKLGLLNCNESLFGEVNSIHSDFLLEVSKFSLLLITRFFKAQDCDARSAYFGTIESNRKRLVSHLKEVGAKPEGGQNINVQLMRLPSGTTSSEVQKELSRQQVGVIDATKLYWADLARGQSSIRIALARDPMYFSAAIETVQQVLARTSQEQS